MGPRIDWTAAATAAGAGLGVIVPGALASELVVGRAGSWLVWLFLAVILGGFGLSGLVAGRLRNDTPILHGVAGALIAFVVAATVGLVIAAVRDRSISIIALPLAALSAVTAGVAGSLLGDVLRRRSRRRAPVGS